MGDTARHATSSVSTKMFIRTCLRLEIYFIEKAPKTTVYRGIADLRDVQYPPSAAIWSANYTKTASDQWEFY